MFFLNMEELKDNMDRSFSSGKNSGKENYVERVWGGFVSIEKGKGYQVKRLTVNVGKRISLQSHFHRSEHWVVVSGVARVTLDNDEIILKRNESVYVPVGAVHRLENCGRIPLEVIEVQNGEYLGEDDIERFEDDFGRAGKTEEYCVGEGCRDRC